MSNFDDMDEGCRRIAEAAWESGYWHGTTHTGPLTDAAVAALNPYTAK